MSFPDKAQRKTCWDSRDKFWECLDVNKIDSAKETGKIEPTECKQLRKLFETSCPSQWVKHFDRKRDYEKFKEKLQKDGFDPVKENGEINSPVTKPLSKMKQRPFKRMDLITTCRKRNISNGQLDDEQYIQFLETSLPLFLVHLQTTFDNFDDQLVCSTCYCTLLSTKSEKTLYIEHMEVALSSYNSIKATAKINLDMNYTKYVISLIYGVYQSNDFLTRISKEDEECVSNIIELSFNILSMVCYEYSQFTFISFKLLHLILTKTIKSKFSTLVDTKKRLKLLAITSQNWENPVTGIREQNRFLFGLFLDLFQIENESDHAFYSMLITNIADFPWNKSKYLILAEVISKDTRSITKMLNKSWLEGLMQSLKISSLVSAGTDMYFSVLKKINTENVWLELFQVKVCEILQTGTFIEVVNLTRYWLLDTVKKFPSLIQYLMQKITSMKIFGSKTLYLKQSLIKYGIKIVATDLHILNEGLNALLTRQDLMKSLQNDNIAMRCQAFEILCTLQKPDTFQIQCELLLEFLQDNCNTDSTPLRQSMFNSLATFLIYIRNTGLKIDGNSCYMSHFSKLFIKLQDFLFFNLELKGNYQRTITSLKVGELILRYFSIHNESIEDKKKGLYRKINVKGDAASLKTLQTSLSWKLDEDRFVLLIFDHLKNPTSDIRETAYKILVSNYAYHPLLLTTHKLTYQNILKSCNSKMFYKTESATTLMKLFLNVDPNNITMELYDTILKEIDEQFRMQKQDILLAIHKEKPLHGILTAFNIFISTVAENRSLNTSNYVSERLEQTLILLQDISNYYLLALFNKRDVDIDLSNHLYPPSFSEIGESIEHIVLTSSFQIEKNDDEEKLSDAHQLVLNCIWLNLKACCELAQCIISCVRNDSKIQTVESYINVILSVLKQCRHKGAIEAAGVALGKTTKSLTSLPKVNNLSSVPMQVLKDFLFEVSRENSAGGSVTRKSAGLAIMMHRLVINDMQYGKPMFHYTMKTLLNIAQDSGSPDIFFDKTVSSEVSNERDIYKAKILHLLCRIVTDSSLASDVMNYASELADICFGNLTSDQWQIRNAALQLYGALLPRLIGQKKSQGINEDSAATVCCDELFTHVPTLWIYINKELTTHSKSDQALVTHSNLVPILSLLAGTAKRYYFKTCSSDEQPNFKTSFSNRLLNFKTSSIDRQLNFTPLFGSLIKLLSSPIYTVRRLSANSLEIIFKFNDFYTYFRHIQKTLNQNSLHGHLMLVLNYKNSMKNCMNEDITKQLSFVIKKLYEMSQVGEASFLIKSIYLEIDKDILKANDCVQDTKDVLYTLNSNITQIGISQWANVRLKQLSTQCVESQIPDMLTMFLNEFDSEQYCTYIKDRVMNDDNISERILQQIIDTLLKCDIAKKQFVLKLAFELIERHSNKFDISTTKYFNLLTSYLNKEHSMIYNSYLLPLIIIMYVLNKTVDVDEVIEEASMLNASEMIKLLTDPEQYDVSKRFLSAHSVNAFADSFKIADVCFAVKVNLLTASVYLLQDEDQDIRKEMGKVCKICDPNTSKDLFLLQSNVCLQKILNVDFLYEIFNSSDLVIQFLKYLKNDVKVRCVKKTKVDRYNPFESESNNIFWEPEAFLELLNSLISNLNK